MTAKYTERRTFLKATGAAGAAALTGLAGCTEQFTGGGGADQITAGVVTGISGPYSFLGTAVVRGLKLGFAQALDADTGNLPDTNTVEGDGITAELIVEDSELQADTGTQAARKLVQQDEVDVLQGSVSSAVASAVQDVASDSETPMMVCTAADTAITGEDCNKWTFRTSQTTYQDALAGGKYAASELGDSFYFLGADYSWGQDSVEQWRTVIEDNGGESAGESFAEFGTEDFTPYLRRASQSDADCLVVALTGTDAITFTRDLQDFDPDYEVTATGVTTIPWMNQVGSAATRFRGIPKYFWTFADNDTNDWIVQQYKELWDKPPSIFTAGAHAAGYAMVQGLQQAGSNGGEDLVDAWHGMEIERTARGDGAYRFRECDHQAEFPIYLGHFEDRETAGMPTTPMLDSEAEAEASIRDCSETGCSMDM